MRALTNIIIVIVLITPIVHPKQYAIAFYVNVVQPRKKAQRSLTKQKQIRAKQLNHIKSKRSSNAQQKHSTAKQSEAGW